MCTILNVISEFFSEIKMEELLRSASRKWGLHPTSDELDQYSSECSTPVHYNMQFI